MKRCILVLAGGQGRRLWPLTHDQLPKHLLVMSDGQTLLEHTLKRFAHEEQLFVVTISAYEVPTRAIAQRYGAYVIVEPEPRNTAAAILYGCRSVQEQYGYDSELVLTIVPADQLIPNGELALYHAALTCAVEYAAEHDSLGLVGVVQRYPSTRFGFIKMGDAIGDDLYHVTQFHEKPTAQTVAQYYGDAGMVWNTGIFVVRAVILYRLYREHAPEFMDALKCYATLPMLQFDRLILEKARNLFVVRGLFSWEDMGSLETFIPHGVTDVPATIEVLHARENIVASRKKTIIAGVAHLCVIETDDLLVIMHRSLAAAPDQIADAVANHDMLGTALIEGARE